MGFAETAPLVAQLDLGGNFVGNLRKAQSQLGSFSTSLGKAGKGVGQIGAGFARVGAILGTVVVGGVIGAAKAAIDFEDAFAGVRKTIDEADLAKAGLSFEILAKQFRTMATEIPIAASEFARIGEAAGALGIRAQDIDDFTKTVALLGVTTDLTTDVAAESLGKIGTILGFTGKDFEDFADILVNLGNKGASVESEIIEITKRFAASGRQAGLSTAEIAAYASAIASAGAEPEAAGSSLSRLFGNLITETARATDKGKAFAEVVGLSFKDFSKIVENDTNGAMLKFLDTLKELSAFDQQRALKAVGITNVRDRNAILLLAETYDENLIPALKNAEEATGSLNKEAQKRFDTIASKLTLLKNNFIEAGIAIGEGFLPALGRVTDKLIAFLKVDANKTALANIGKDLGKALDGINWQEVLAGARTFYGVVKTIFDVLNSLPTEIKAAAAAFLVLNKASGGLIGAGAGNIVGGLAGAAIQGAASRAPGVGRLFAQPVFVTNWAMMAGGGLGAAGAVGAASIWSKVGTLIAGAFTIVAAATIAEEVHKAISPGGGLEGRTQGEGGGLLPADELQWPFGPKNTPRWVIDTPFGAVNVLGGDSAFAPRPAGDLASRGLGNKPGGPGDLASRGLGNANVLGLIRDRALAAGFKGTPAAVAATNQRNLERLAKANLAAVERTRAAQDRTTVAALLTAAAVQNQDRKPPITNVKVNVNVTAAQVSKSVTIQRRFGPAGGSRDRPGSGSGPQEF